MDPDHRERIVAAYRSWAPSYDRLMRSAYHRVERAITRAHVLEALPADRGARLLDVGGGDGTWCSTLLMEGRAGSAVLLDLSPEMLALGRRRIERRALSAACAHGDATSLPFPDRAFDVTLALGGVLSHLDEPRRGLAELARVTRVGGHVVVSVDALAVGIRTAVRARDDALLAGILERGRGRAFHHESHPFEVRFFSPEEIRALAGELGLEILSLIGKPVFTRFLGRKEILSEGEVAARVELEMGFVRDPRFIPFADQIELVGRVGAGGNRRGA